MNLICRTLLLIALITVPTQAATEAKRLYLENSGGTTLSRTASTSTAATNIAGSGGTAVFNLSPTTAQAMALPASTLNVSFWAYRSTHGGNTRTVDIAVTYSGPGGSGTIASITGQALNLPVQNVGGITYFSFNIAQSAVTAAQLAAGSTITVTITNQSTNANRQISIVPLNAGTNSRLLLNVTDPLTVTSVVAYDTIGCSGGVVNAGNPANPGDTVYVCTVVSDVFGGYDINPSGIATERPDVTITDSDSVVQVTAADMAQFSGPTGATKTFQYAYAVPSTANCPAIGTWDLDVTAFEGFETPLISATGSGTMVTDSTAPSISITKMVATLSDPLGGNAYQVPGSVMRYTVTVTNSAAGCADLDSVDITDVLPANVEFEIGNSCADAISFTPNTSGLSFACATDLGFSSQGGGGAPYSYDPYASLTGYDPTVTGIQLLPQGKMNANSSFSFTFEVRVE